MKLELTLPERPGFLHVVPLFNLFALLLMFFVLGPSLVLQAGKQVELPPSKFQMERFTGAQVVTLGPGSPAKIYLGREAISLDALGKKLDERRGSGPAAVLLRADVGTPVVLEQEVSELILRKNYKVMLVGRPAQVGASDTSSSKETDQ
ncbi:biopolymer transporter ExbD [Luteolibacter ambystomatis]|uniref:Biopolymer transporter ExbD n=1 Tax=Luteolibacter ambystomatis TaxID=2824561 RepID=A0A975PFY0_9BACT|nr:biopolymer transporter ExbD [Luteolibacter ambystomatis]QUE51867.1 biopolymer transporter ExbD [Luteolibacter ambystomatis]